MAIFNSKLLVYQRVCFATIYAHVVETGTTLASKFTKRLSRGLADFCFRLGTRGAKGGGHFFPVKT